MLLRKHKSYICIALVLFALASVALPKQAIAFEFSVPTEVNAVLMPDGAVVKSSFSTGTNTSEDPLVVSGDLSLNDGFKGSLIFNNQNNTKDIEVNVGDKIDGSVDITKIDNSLDYSKKNIIGSINWSIQPKIKTAFAVYSADDGSLNFYKRSSVPKAGEQFEGKTATKVYTGVETDIYTNIRYAPWYTERREVTDVFVADQIKPISTAYWFYGCANLTSANLSKLDASDVVNMQNMFFYCSSLLSLDVSNFNTSNVANMHQMFTWCSSLTNLDVSHFDTGNVTDMTSMFNGCSSLTSLDLSSFNTSKVANMSSMFNGCSKLQQVKLGNKFAWKGTNGYLPTPSSRYIPGADGKWYAMSDGTGYAPENIPSNKADTYVASPDLLPKPEAFAVYSADDQSLNFYKRISVPKAGEQFEGKTATEVYTGIEKLSSLFMPWSQHKTSITNSTVIDTIKPISTSNWFSNFTALTTADLSKMDTSATNDMQSMFFNCTSLTSLNLSGLDTSNVVLMNEMFNYCSSLTSLDLSSFNTSKVTNMREMFRGCRSLTSLDLSNFNTSNVKNMDAIFQSCSNLTSIDLSSFNTSSVTRMEQMFSYCSSLTSLDLSHFNTSNVTLMDYMFEDCSSLTSLNLSNFNTSNVTTMFFMFDDCSSLTTLDISMFDNHLVSEMSNMFNKCYKLQQIKLGNKFSWKGNEGYLPTPSSNYIPGADGKWYAGSDSKGYAPADIPSNKADTYYASKDLLPKMTGNIQISGSNSPGSTLSAIVEGVPSNANIGYQWYIGVGSKDFEYVVTDIFVDDGIRSKVGEATLSDKDIILFKGQETGSYSMDAEVINSSGAVVFKKTFNENSNSAYFKPSESGVYKVKVRLISGSALFGATKRALEFEKIDGETSQSLNILDNQEYRTFMCKAFDKSGKYLGEISSEKVTITPKAKLLK